jgi:hypothetical protein
MNALTTSCLCVGGALLLAHATTTLVAAQSDVVRDISELPQQIWVSNPLHDVVVEMWNRSPTFRRQCREVAAYRTIQVQIRLDPNLVHDPIRNAFCDMVQYNTGTLIARISVSPYRLHELIAHEMEHVCERIEGIKVEREARLGRAGFYVIGRAERHYETDRAARVGRQVEAELTMSPMMTRAQ